MRGECIKDMSNSEIPLIRVDTSRQHPYVKPDSDAKIGWSLEDPEEIGDFVSGYYSTKEKALQVAASILHNASDYHRHGLLLRYGQWYPSAPYSGIKGQVIGESWTVKENPSLSSRITEAYKDVKHAITKRSKSAAAMKRLEEAQRPAEGGMVRPGKFGIGKKNPISIPVYSYKVRSQAEHDVKVLEGRGSKTARIVDQVRKGKPEYTVVIDENEKYIAWPKKRKNPESSASDLTFDSLPVGSVFYFTSPKWHESPGPYQKTSNRDYVYLEGRLKGRELGMSIGTGKTSVRMIKNNPESSASDLYEDFHGRAPSELVEVHYEQHEHENLTALGALAQLKIITPFKKQCIINVVETKSPKTLPDPSQIPRDQRVFLCSNEDGNQLYFVGGDQEVDVYALGFSEEDIKDSMLLGVLDELTYQTEKGFDNFETISYYHKLGEESGVEPVLIYDTVSKLLSVSGGRYMVKPEGIVD